jgi:hypothetical protein
MRQKEQFLEGLINKLGPEHLSCWFFSINMCVIFFAWDLQHN